MRDILRTALSRSGSAIARALLALALFGVPHAAFAAPWMWDQDEDGIDDRLTAVFLGGLLHAREDLDPEGLLRFEVSTLDTLLWYGGYVLYDHPPTAGDSTLLALAGAQVVTRFLSVPYIRIRAPYPSLITIATLPGVERIEAVTLMYPVNLDAARAAGVRAGARDWPSAAGAIPGGAAPTGAPFPALRDVAPLTGQGTVVAILDTGINDGPIGLYPGHADLSGKVVGGAWFGGPGPLGYSPWTASVNPNQATVGLPGYHGTHVAGTIAGGTVDRPLGGIAPGARLVDVKVLDDHGTGNGLAEGLEWCLQNRTRNWGGGLSGIHVVNLSLSGLDPSDGGDCVSRLVNAAAAAGLVVVAAAGNGGACGELPSPGAADGALTIGAIDPATLDGSGRPALAEFSNEGPRSDDGDLDALDEYKPDLVAVGVDVTSAWGGPLDTGLGYRSASGTSMATAVVSGVVALLREADPGASPATITTLLRDTARRRTGATHACSEGHDPDGVSAAWHAGYGFGEVDALAAWLELTSPSQTQFVAVGGAWNGAAVDVHWTTQRELDLTGFVVERAPDLAGTPGTFTAVGPGTIPAVGVSAPGVVNRTSYLIDDTPPPGAFAWYRVRTTGGGLTDVAPAFRVFAGAPAATARVTLAHQRPEIDLTLAIGTGLVLEAPAWWTPLTLDGALTGAAPATGLPGEDRTAVTLDLPLYAVPGAQLPPSMSTPWWVRVVEGGSPAHGGRLESFAMDLSGTPYTSVDPLPRETSEGNATVAWIPTPPISGAGGTEGAPSWHPAMTPVPGDPMAVRLHLAPGTAARLTVHDVLGRPVVTLLDGAAPPAGSDVRWSGVDRAGRRSASGRYWLRLEAAGARTVVPVTLAH